MGDRAPHIDPEHAGAIWIVPDEDLLAMLNEHAVKRNGGGIFTMQLLDELDRRERAKLNRTMLRLTRLVAVLTLVATVLAGVSVYLAATS
jgi:hypothetical protein